MVLLGLRLMRFVHLFFIMRMKKVFSRVGTVTLQTLMPAKGHEAGFIFVMGMDYTEDPYNNYKYTQLRNAGFTAITWTNGYLTVTHSGPRGKLAIRELNELNEATWRIGFEVPGYSDLRRIYAEDMSKDMNFRRRKRELEAF